MSVETGAAPDRQLWLIGQLRQGGRATPARLFALRVLEDADGHLSVSEIHRRIAAKMPRVNLSTVYRTLERLEGLGLVHRLDVAGEARFGSDEPAHHHAVCVCTRCGRVLELDAAVVSSLLSGLEAVIRLRPDRSSGLTVRGICDICHAAGRLEDQLA